MNELFIFVTTALVYTVRTRWNKYPNLNRKPLILDTGLGDYQTQEILKRPTISFSGCGTAYHFYMGVTEYMTDTFDISNVNVLCTSGSIWVAVPFILRRSVKEWHDNNWVDCYMRFSNRLFKLCLDSNTFIRKQLNDYLPPDAYKRCSNRLFIVLTKWSWIQCRFVQDIVYQYESNDQLIDALIGTINIPGIFYSPQYHRGKICWDGCFTNQKPLISNTANHITTVGILGKSSDINTNNLFRFRDLMPILPSDCDFHRHWYSCGYTAAKHKQSVFDRSGFKRKKTYIDLGWVYDETSTNSIKILT